MCGIAGAVWNDPSKALERTTLQRMIDVLRHRGPDGEGAYLAEGRFQPGGDLARRAVGACAARVGRLDVARQRVLCPHRAAETTSGELV